MSLKMSINFETFEDLECYVRDVNKFKLWKSKQEKRKKSNPDNETNEQFSFTDDRRGLYQQHYHNQAKIYKAEHPELSYRETFKKIIKIIKKMKY